MYPPLSASTCSTALCCDGILSRVQHWLLTHLPDNVYYWQEKKKKGKEDKKSCLCRRHMHCFPNHTCGGFFFFFFLKKKKALNENDSHCGILCPCRRGLLAGINILYLLGDGQREQFAPAGDWPALPSPQSPWLHFHKVWLWDFNWEQEAHRQHSE